MQDFLNDIWVSDFGSDTQCTFAQWAQGQIPFTRYVGPHVPLVT
jgi:hypothetical protein